MQISHLSRPFALLADPGQNAVDGIREQFDRFERNVAEVAQPQNGEGFAAGARDRALVEQIEIEQAVRANAKSLEAANETLGTIIDIEV